MGEPPVQPKPREPHLAFVHFATAECRQLRNLHPLWHDLIRNFVCISGTDDVFIAGWPQMAAAERSGRPPRSTSVGGPLGRGDSPGSTEPSL